MSIQYISENISLLLGQAAQGDNIIANFLPIILIMVAMFFFMIRPQMKRQKEHRLLITGLQIGDEVMTHSGIAGRILEINDTYIVLDIAYKEETPVRIMMQKVAVSTALPKGTIRGL